jgi:multidrug efflux pump subunit AcrA (membrane-fusion protein)
MKTAKRILIAVLGLGLVAVIAYRASTTIQAKKRAMSLPPAEKIVSVETASPARIEIEEKIHASANIQAASEVTIFSKVSGKIARTLVEMSSPVQPGQTVAVVNRDEVGYDYKPFEVKCEARGVVARVLQNPGAAVNPSVPLMTVVDIDSVKAVAAVDEKKIRFIKLGQPARVTLEAYPGEAFQARVTNISPVANLIGRTVEVELAIPNPSHRIKPGMYAGVEWTESRRPALTVPLAAVVDRADGKCVFLADGNQARLLQVVVGAVVGDAIEILSGLKGDEPVITTGAGLLNDRDRIRIISAAPAAK